MPHILSPIIHEDLEGMWAEGAPYSKKSIYSIQEAKLPPVNYDAHHIKSHSITHAEAPKHTQKDGAGIDAFFKDPNFFFGKAQVLRLMGDNYKLVDKENSIFHWEVSLEELQSQLLKVPSKLLLTTDIYPTTETSPYHDPKYVLTLSIEAANWLVSSEGFNLYGTSWKSSDYNPGAMDRPIHDTLFSKAIILECLDLKSVPSGEYFFVGAPIPLKGASESPVCPMLFEKDEIQNIF